MWGSAALRERDGDIYPPILGAENLLLFTFQSRFNFVLAHPVLDVKDSALPWALPGPFKRPSLARVRSSGGMGPTRDCETRVRRAPEFPNRLAEGYVSVFYWTSTWRRNIILKNKNKFPQGVYIKEDFTKETLDIRKSLQPKLEEERNKGNIAYLRGDKLIVKKPTDIQKSEKRKRESSFSPNQGSGTLSEPSSSAGHKKIAAKNAFEFMSRPRSNSLKEKTNK
ncbi:unnamed protein product [Diatraea saccharalis]|uniref:Uncharacterized protein n=1 Tax=Diatraea saccharalis TaxID=40085 RepID=A0A9N9R4L5_9NEOP|nr:unnamed protein product [Diatraea saccharalis]